MDRNLLGRQWETSKIIQIWGINSRTHKPFKLSSFLISLISFSGFQTLIMIIVCFCYKGSKNCFKIIKRLNKIHLFGISFSFRSIKNKKEVYYSNLYVLFILKLYSSVSGIAYMNHLPKDGKEPVERYTSPTPLTLCEMKPKSTSILKAFFYLLFPPGFWCTKQNVHGDGMHVHRCRRVPVFWFASCGTVYQRWTQHCPGGPQWNLVWHCLQKVWSAGDLYSRQFNKVQWLWSPTGFFVIFCSCFRSLFELSDSAQRWIASIPRRFQQESRPIPC